MTLSDHLTPIGIKITSTSIVRVDLPTELREAIIVSEHNDIYADSRISLLQKYPKVFGAHPEQTMSHCTQWELLNLLHQNGELQVILAAPNLSLDTLPPRIEQSHPTLIDQSG